MVDLNSKYIGSGASGSICRTNWKNIDTIFALKSFYNQRSTLKEIVNELKLHRHVHFHANIIKFYGVTFKEQTDAINQMNNYSLVLEYADNGTLKTYLDEHFNELEWNNKFDFALQLANAVLCLHECDIIHRDLHATLAIKGGKREEIIDGTPIEYSNIYTKCWEGEPDNRPDIQEIVSGLRAINSTGNNIFMNSMKEIHGILPAYDSNSSSKLTSDINNSLVIDNIVYSTTIES
ncbi:unnamed protein product [Rhizophagus irregularis]|uniref:Protein kinase domain-containing protein n=1 Tax=Rhizophagus irregularis TaxID=588596 RepID=A0A915ZAE9_9GLOM|nr:unnamed protein product [Rhizophagus irregularis]